jgi:hypothetical protein
MHRGAQRLDDARDMFARSLAVTQSLGAEHPANISTLHNLGGAEAMRGDLDAAATHILGALEQARAVWGEDHPRTDEIAVSMANVRLQQARFDDASAIGCPSARRARDRLGVDHPTAERASAVCSAAIEQRGENSRVVD